MSICRFCDLPDDPQVRMIKYSVRHYAHPVCFYKRCGIEAVDALETWQIRYLPVLLMMEGGVSLEKIHEWSARIKAEDELIDDEYKDRQ